MAAAGTEVLRPAKDAGLRMTKGDRVHDAIGLTILRLKWARSAVAEITGEDQHQRSKATDGSVRPTQFAPHDQRMRRCQASRYSPYLDFLRWGERTMVGWWLVARMGRMYQVSVGMT